VQLGYCFILNRKMEPQFLDNWL